MNNRKLQVWLPALFALVMVAGMYLGYRLRENTNTAGSFFRMEKKSPLQEVLDLVRLKYVDPINTDTLGDDAIREMLMHLDPHSVFIPASDLKNTNADLMGNFDGIGVEFQVFSDTVNVVNVLKGGPSDKAGLQAGDKLISADGKPLTKPNIQSEDIRVLLRGPRDSKVELGIIRGGKEIKVTVTRGRIPLPALDAAYMIEPGTGFIRISKFSETTYEEFMQSLEKLQAQGMKKLILDLRSNGGGLLNEAIDMADEFLDDNKLIVYTEGNKVPRQDYRARRMGLFEKGDLVLLMDESSASASEVLAGALQDWDRATIVGRRSFGKGLVQEQYQLGDGSALRITVARYYTPLGRSIQKPYDKGVKIYQEEVSERFHNGEILRADTAYAVNGKIYNTKAGKKLYGGGGITPDVVVPIDTALYAPVLSELYVKNTISNFVYNYYLSNKKELDALKGPSDLAGYLSNKALLPLLVEFARKDSIQVPSLNTIQQNELERRTRNLLARQIWRNEGYFELSNATDPMVQQALKTLHK